MDLREVLKATTSSLVALPSQRSPSLDPRDSYRASWHGNTQNHACIYCRRSHMSCDLVRPCTRCIKRNIAHLCHDEPRDDDSKKSQSVQTAQTAQTNTTSLLNSNLKSCHYTISRDHTKGAEDQKCKILADFGKTHIRAWTNLSLANLNSPTADPDTSAVDNEFFDPPGPYAARGGF
ncbi:hypothetical protein ACJA88_015052 [Fusarium oxysporum]